MFRDRHDAARQLERVVRDLPLVDPLVLAIPRGGVVIGAVLADALAADLDVVLSRKLRAPHQPELAIGAVGEDGQVQLNELARQLPEVTEAYLERECHHQLQENARRQRLYRQVRERAPVAGRSVLIADDGIATGSTLMAALQSTRPLGPHELIVAVPVAAPDRLEHVRRYADRAVCLHTPTLFWAIGQFYERFEQVVDREVVGLLRAFGTPEDRRVAPRGSRPAAHTR